MCTPATPFRPLHRVLRRTTAGAIAVLALLCISAQASEQACTQEAQYAPSVVAAAIATIALQQNAYFGGQIIDTAGGMIHEGWYEAERDRTGPDGVPAWQRVWDYWRAVPAVYERDFAWREAGGTAEQRVAMVDYPWSAAFISWLMRSAGLSDAQFRFSTLHADYVRAAIGAGEAEAAGQPTPYAYRACDLADTAPRQGDLMCFARAGDAGLDTYDAVRAALRHRALSMHCELVAQTGPAWIATVGGNVVQSVTLRELAAAPGGGGLLDASYRTAAQTPHAQTAGVISATATAPVVDRHLSLQPWSVLLQLRSVAFTNPTQSAPLPLPAPAGASIAPPASPDHTLYLN